MNKLNSKTMGIKRRAIAYKKWMVSQDFFLSKNDDEKKELTDSLNKVFECLKTGDSDKIWEAIIDHWHDINYDWPEPLIALYESADHFRTESGAEMSQIFKIKNFGNDCVCQSIEELVSSLSTEYKGKHVSVLTYNKDCGTSKKINFISVSIDGLISLSYVNDSGFETASQAVEYFTEWFDLR